MMGKGIRDTHPRVAHVIRDDVITNWLQIASDGWLRSIRHVHPFRGVAGEKMRRVYSAPLVGALLVVATGTLTMPAAAATAAPATLTYAKTLAGPSEAAMYPSGLIWDAHSNRLVVADTGYNRISVYDPSACPVPDTSTCAPIETFGSYGSGQRPVQHRPRRRGRRELEHLRRRRGEQPDRGLQLPGHVAVDGR